MRSKDERLMALSWALVLHLGILWTLALALDLIAALEWFGACKLRPARDCAQNAPTNGRQQSLHRSH